MPSEKRYFILYSAEHTDYYIPIGT